MKIIEPLKKSIIGLYESIRRFPAAIGFSTAAAVIIMVLVHNEQNFSSDTKQILGRIAMVLALGIPVSLCINMVFERRREIPLAVRALAYGTEAAGLILYYFFLLKSFNMVPVTRYIGFSLAFYLAFVFIPYFFRRDGFELYVVRLLTRFFTTVLYSVVLYLGIVAIIFTVEKLLEIGINEKLYFDVWLAVVAVFATSFFLAGVPMQEEQLGINSYSKLLKVLLLYIVMPLTAIYTAILYIYFAKIIITVQWPVGIVAHLVLWYSVVCTAIILLASPLQNESRWAGRFMFIMPKLIIPLIIMMFLSVGIRVKAYGVTENRYYVIALGLWVLGVMMYLNLAGNKRNIVLPVSLALIAILSVAGPLSSYSVSKFSQNQRFEGLLEKYGMLQNGFITRSDKEISMADKKEISEILHYFSRSHSLEDVRYLPEGFKLSQMEQVFGFDADEFGNVYINNRYFAYNSGAVSSPIDIRGYSYMFRMSYYGSIEPVSAYDMEISYDDSSQEILINAEGRQIYKKSVANLVKQLREKLGEDSKHNVPLSDMSFEEENENIKVKIVFSHIDGHINEDEDSMRIDSMEFYMLVRK